MKPFSPSWKPEPGRIATLRVLTLIVTASSLGGCLSPAAKEHRRTSQREATREVQDTRPVETAERLALDLKALGPEADPWEARLLAETAVNGAIELAGHYRAVRPAWFHNILVNAGIKPRGLCYHWANDLEAILAPLPVQSFQVHPVVSRLRTAREHNALVVTLRGKELREGILLDAWRHSGSLYWCGFLEDRRHEWRPLP